MIRTLARFRSGSSRSSRVVLVAMLVAVVVGSGLGPAGAHDGLASRSGWMEKNIDGQGTWSWSHQNHSYHQIGVGSYLEYDFGNLYTQSCAKQWERPGGHLVMRAEWYRDGYGPCAFTTTSGPYQGWISNPYDLAAMYWEWDGDVWHLGCNAGPGVHTWITMDTWQYVWGARGSNRWIGGAARPAHGHCHCP